MEQMQFFLCSRHSNKEQSCLLRDIRACVSRYSTLLQSNYEYVGGLKSL